MRVVRVRSPPLALGFSVKDFLEVGYVNRAHGLHGEVSVKTFDPASETLFEVERVLVRTRDGAEKKRVIENVRSAAKELLVKFEDVRGRTDSEALVGSTILASREDLEEPAEGEFFQGDLIGLVARSESGEELGKVEELWSHGEVPNLVIRAPGKPELVVPFADEFVPAVDLAAGTVTVKPPEFTE